MPARPKTRARARLRCGSRILPTGDSENSKPVRANRHRAEAVAILPKEGGGALIGWSGPPVEPRIAAITTTATSGRILTTTVTMATSPAALIPRRFTSVRIKKKIDARMTRWVESEGTILPSAAAVASATAGFPTQVEHQV